MASAVVIIWQFRYLVWNCSRASRTKDALAIHAPYQSTIFIDQTASSVRAARDQRVVKITIKCLYCMPSLFRSLHIGIQFDIRQRVPDWCIVLYCVTAGVIHFLYWPVARQIARVLYNTQRTSRIFLLVYEHGISRLM